MSRQVLAGVVAAVAAFTLSGCGSASPGVAVRVGDETLSTTRVDELTVAYCEGVTPQLESGGLAFRNSGNGHRSCWHDKPRSVPGPEGRCREQRH